MSNTIHTRYCPCGPWRECQLFTFVTILQYTESDTRQYPNMLDWKYCGGESFDGTISNKYYLLYHRCATHIYIISLYFIFAQELYLTHVLSN